MKILIVNNMAPFVWGGAEELAVNLKKNLLVRGYEAEILRIPFQWEPTACIPSQMLMVKGFELTNVDRVIALKFPAYLIKHPHKTLWLLHQYRQAYDLYDPNYPYDPDSKEIFKLIKKADNQIFLECKKIFTNSKVTQNRLATYNDFRKAHVLYPPLNDAELFTGGPSEGYIFAGGRLNEMKRQHLLIEAMAQSPKNTRLIIAGPPDHSDYANRLRQQVTSLGLTDRVTLDIRFLSRKEIAHYVNHALACAYLPIDEDSLGYVSMESVSAAKALISCKDSGGILNLINHSKTGWICDPTPKSLAEAISIAYQAPSKTQKMGEKGQQKWLGMNINWDHTINSLLS